MVYTRIWPNKFYSAGMRVHSRADIVWFALVIMKNFCCYKLSNYVSSKKTYCSTVVMVISMITCMFWFFRVRIFRPTRISVEKIRFYTNDSPVRNRGNGLCTKNQKHSFVFHI
jgi:hypothetical protein